MIKKGIFWDFLGKVFNQGVGFIVSIVLTRLLLPEDFALIAMVMVVVAIAAIFVDFDLGVALIQRKEVDDIHYNSTFWLNMGLAFTLAILTILGAPLVASCYKQPELVELTRVLSVTFIFNALGGVHNAMLRRDMNFRYISFVNILSASLSGILGIGLAYSGYGVWALVAQSLCASVLRPILLWYGTKWLPKIDFSWGAIKPLWGFSNKVFLANTINVIFSKLDIFVIGRLFQPATLGYYSRAKALNNLVNTYSSMSLTAVLFPALSKIQDQVDMVRHKVKDFYHLAAMIAFFLTGFLYLIAEDLLILMYTERWAATVPYFRILALGTFAYPVSAIIITPINSLGRSDLVLKAEVLKKTMLGITYIVGFYFGLEEFLYAMAFTLGISVPLNGWYANKVILWPVFDQVKVLLTYGIMALIGVAPLYLFFTLDVVPSYILHLILTSLIYSLYFVGANYMLRTRGFQISLIQFRQIWNKVISRA